MFYGYQKGIYKDSTKWFTLEKSKSVGSTCIYIPGTPGGPCVPFKLNRNITGVTSLFCYIFELCVILMLGN